MIPYDDGVRKAKSLATEIAGNQDAIGEIADQLEPKYGSHTLQRFSEEIEIPYETVKRWRATYRAYSGNQLGGAPPLFNTREISCPPAPAPNT